MDSALEQVAEGGSVGSALRRTVVLFDVDNTLLDNDRVQEDLGRYLENEFGAGCRTRYFDILERLRQDLGYTDYLGALQRYRAEHPGDPRVLALSLFLIEYPFADRLYGGVPAVVDHARRWGLPVLLSDGDAVFQPWKVKCSGLWRAFRGEVLIYTHKEQALDDVAHRYPAEGYLLIDDKLRILSAVKRAWGARVTTVFARQGHYADPAMVLAYPPADVTLDRIGELGDWTLADLLAAAQKAGVDRRRQGMGGILT